VSSYMDIIPSQLKPNRMHATYKVGSTNVSPRTHDTGLKKWSPCQLHVVRTIMISRMLHSRIQKWSLSYWKQKKRTGCAEIPKSQYNEDLKTDEDSEWLCACKWPTWFKHKPIPLLATATVMPTPSCLSALYLGRMSIYRIINEQSERVATYQREEIAEPLAHEEVIKIGALNGRRDG
jgi:hypothetical protein